VRVCTCFVFGVGLSEFRGEFNVKYDNIERFGRLVREVMFVWTTLDFRVFSIYSPRAFAFFCAEIYIVSHSC